MYRKAVNYLRGQAVAEVVCTAPERVVNLCAAHGITPVESVLAEQQWEQSGQENYPPQEIGNSLVVLPVWLADSYETNRKKIILDPGIAFGTGYHPTTQMVVEEMEDRLFPGCTCLDLGSGSGILSIAALLLGADRAVACDIDEKCMDVAYENAALNGIGKDRYTVLVGNVLSDGALRAQLGGGYDVVVANIVADVIIGLAPMVRQFLKPGGLFLCSGIIDTRADEVAEALRQNGWTIEATRSGEGWFSYACR